MTPVWLTLVVLVLIPVFVAVTLIVVLWPEKTKQDRTTFRSRPTNDFTSFYKNMNKDQREIFNRQQRIDIQAGLRPSAFKDALQSSILAGK